MSSCLDFVSSFFIIISTYSYHRGLIRLERERFDKIFDYARMHGDAGTMVNIPNKMDTVLVSVLTELIGRIEDIEAAIEEKPR